VTIHDIQSIAHLLLVSFLPSFTHCSFLLYSLLRFARRQFELSPAQVATLVDSLQFSATCPMPNVSSALPPRYTPAPVRVTTEAFFYVASEGSACSDGNAGTIQAPFCSIVRAVSACRAASQKCFVLLRGGVHRLNATVELTSQDNGLTLASYSQDPEPAVITGAMAVTGEWEKWSTVEGRTTARTCTQYPGADSSSGSDLPGSGFETASPDDCVAACEQAGCLCAGGVWGKAGSTHLCYIKRFATVDSFRACSSLLCASAATRPFTPIRPRTMWLSTALRAPRPSTASRYPWMLFRRFLSTARGTPIRRIKGAGEFLMF
jgi:hypothetical protein